MPITRLIALAPNYIAVILASVWIGAAAGAAEELPSSDIEERTPAVSETDEAVQAIVEALEQQEEELDRALAHPAEEREPIHLDLAAAVQRALADNPRTAIAESEVDAARARVRQARSAMLPDVSLQSAYTYLDYDYTDVDLGGQLPILGAVTRTLGSSAFSELVPDKDTRTDRLQARQVLFAGGSIRAAATASRFLAKSKEWRRDAELQDLAFEVREAYYKALLTDSLIRVAEESVHTFERNLHDAEALSGQGMVSRFELLRAETELSARQADATAARNARRLAQSNLRRLLNIPQGTPLVLEEDFGGSPTLQPIEGAVAEARDQRPELRALRAAHQAGEADVRRTRGEFLPQVGASMEYTNVDGGAAITPEGWGFSVGAEWDLYTGGQRRAGTQEARAEVRGLMHEIREVEQLVELEVTNAYIELRDAMEAVRSARDTVEWAREGLRMAEIRFQEGVGTQSELLEAELALTDAETRLAEALHDFSVASAALDKALGRPVEDLAAPDSSPNTAGQESSASVDSVEQGPSRQTPPSPASAGKADEYAGAILRPID